MNPARIAPAVPALVALLLAGPRPVAAAEASPAPAPAAASAAAAAATTASRLESLAFMAGHWEADGSEESWLAPKAGLMVGMSRSVSPKGRASFEFLRIEQRADGVVYVASPGGGPTTEFRLTRVDAQAATFENPEHDFPKRIAYRRDGASLSARVDDGSAAGKGFDLRWTLRSP